MYAQSAVTGSPLQTYLPPTPPKPFLGEPFIRVVVGRRVRRTASPVLKFMWSRIDFNISIHFSPNNFVPLLHVPGSEESITTADDFPEIEEHTGDKFDELDKETDEVEMSSLRADPDLNTQM